MQRLCAGQAQFGVPVCRAGQQRHSFEYNIVISTTLCAATTHTNSVCDTCLQAERSLESLYAELVSNGIIRPCPPTSLTDFFGNDNFLGGVLAAQGLFSDPAVAQVRRVLTQYCIYPLGSATVHLK